MRMTPTRGYVTSSGDVTRVSDTVGHRTQLPPTSTSDTAYEATAKVNTLDGEQSRQIKSILDKVSTQRIQLVRSDLMRSRRSVILR
jgi:hypothetical protein